MNDYHLDNMARNMAEYCDAVAPESVRIAAFIAHTLTSWELLAVVTLTVIGSVAKAYIRSRKA